MASTPRPPAAGAAPSVCPRRRAKGFWFYEWDFGVGIGFLVVTHGNNSNAGEVVLLRTMRGCRPAITAGKAIQHTCRHPSKNITFCKSQSLCGSASNQSVNFVLIWNSGRCRAVKRSNRTPAWLQRLQKRSTSPPGPASIYTCSSPQNPPRRETTGQSCGFLFLRQLPFRGAPSRLIGLPPPLDTARLHPLASQCVAFYGIP